MEAIVAIGIIMTGVFGSLTLVISNIASVNKAYNTLIATQLAQEGIEVVRNLRDSNWLKKGVSWDNGLQGVADNTAIAVFDVASNSWQLDFTPNDFNDDATILHRVGLTYIQSLTNPGGIITPFRRLITIIDQGGNKKIVRSEVQWQIKEEKKSIVAEEYLYNWR